LKWSETLERSIIQTVEEGKMTKDLAMCISGGKPVDSSKYLTTEKFMQAIEETFKKNMS
jgi:isocitrate dehydrogenase